MVVVVEIIITFVKVITLKGISIKVVVVAFEVGTSIVFRHRLKRIFVLLQDEDKVVTVAEVFTVELHRTVQIVVVVVQHIKHSPSTFKSTDFLLKRMRKCASFLLIRHILFTCPLFSLLLFWFFILFKRVSFDGTIGENKVEVKIWNA